MNLFMASGDRRQGINSLVIFEGKFEHATKMFAVNNNTNKKI